MSPASCPLASRPCNQAFFYHKPVPWYWLQCMLGSKPSWITRFPSHTAVCSSVTEFWLTVEKFSLCVQLQECALREKDMPFSSSLLPSTVWLPEPEQPPGTLQHVGFFFPHQATLHCQLGVLQFNSMLTLWAWRWNQLPGVKAQPHQTSDANSKCSFSPVLLTKRL